MANEISSNNIKQSYDLAENKIFPKTTINGIVFDSDDSVVGSSAIVKSLVNENLLVKNIEVNTDSSTGGYIHLKTNNGDASGVSVLELKLGHKGVDDTSTNKIYINEANDPNTDVTAFFNKMEVSSTEYVWKVGTATIKSGDMNVKIDKSGVAVNDGSVTAGTYHIGNGGNIGSSIEGLIELSSDKIYAGYIKQLVFADNKIKLDSDASGIKIHGGKWDNKIIAEEFDTIGLNAPNTIVYNEEGEVRLALSKDMRGEKCAYVNFDASPNVTLNFQINYYDGEQNVQFSEYPIQYEHLLHGGDSYLHLNAYTNTHISSYLHIDADSIDASTYNELSLHSGKDCYIESDTSIHIVAPSITGTVNGVNDVLMGVPIGSVVKWLNSSVPEGWCRKSELDNCAYVGFLVKRQMYTDASGIHRSLSTIYKLKGEEYAVGEGNKLEVKNCLVYNHDGEEFDDTSHYIMLKSGYVLGLNGCDASNFGKYTFYHVFKGKYEDDGLLYEHSRDKNEFSVSGIYDSSSRLYFEQYNTQEESLSVVMEGVLPLLVCRDASNNIVKGKASKMGKDIYNGAVTLFSGISDMTIFDNVSKDEIIKYK